MDQIAMQFGRARQRFRRRSCSLKARQARNDDRPQALAVSFLTAEIAAIPAVSPSNHQ